LRDVPNRPQVHRAGGVKPKPVENRGTAAQRGYGAAWQQARKAYLAANPLCRSCEQMNPPRITAAVVVDHVIPHRGDQERFWNEANWQSLCKRCHNVKTAKGQ
jgi:5-methylcytosine-specific restriction protein A